MYEVFNNDSLIILNEIEISKYSNIKSFEVRNLQELKEYVIPFLEENKSEDVMFFGYNLQKMFLDFCSLFYYLEAAGGIVHNTEGEILCIKRLGYCDFPKGKIEKNESPENAAVREVEEETAVNELLIIKELKPSFHIYKFKGKLILKKTYWYEMKTNFAGILIPQTDEDIISAEWHKKNNISILLNDSYRSLREGFKDFFN